MGTATEVFKNILSFDYLSKIDVLISLGTFIWGIIVTQVYNFLTKTNVTIVATKNDYPDDTSVKRALGWHKEICRTRLIENLDLQNTQDYPTRISDFYYRNQSKIDDLKCSNRSSLFLLAHQSIMVNLGYNLQDQKTIKLYHKLRDTYGNSWSWESFWHLNFASFKNWYIYIRGWIYKVTSSATIDYEKDIVLKVEVSFPINSQIDGVDETNFYAITLKKGSLVGNKQFLRRYSQIEAFQKEFQRVFNLIDSQIAIGKNIHLLINVPAPFAFIIGTSIHASSRSTVYLYEEKGGKYEKTFTLKKP